MIAKLIKRMCSISYYNKINLNSSKFISYDLQMIS